jgi:hypothetical protein
MLRNVIVNVQNETLISINAWKSPRFNASFNRKIGYQMTSTLVHNAFHAQLPGGQIDILDLKQ